MEGYRRERVGGIMSDQVTSKNGFGNELCGFDG